MMMALYFAPDNPKDWIDAALQILKLIFGDRIPPMLLRGVGCVLALGLLLLALWGALAVASRIKSLWLEQFWPLFYDADALKGRELRRRFADHVESEVRRLNNLEQWSDHRFAELEAEVEAEGSSATPSLRGLLGLKRRNTLRRENSLSDALANSSERQVLLEGDPGSGKSVALRHLTKVLASKAMFAKRMDSAIPIYVNLKELARNDEQEINKDLIRSFVLHVLNRTNSRDVSEFLDDKFDAGLRDGTWIFLFDSFDEIPEILSSVEADKTIKSYSEAIADFLGGFNRCRGIVASRQFRGPGRLGWVRFRILPLTPARKRELIRKAALDTTVETELIAGLQTATPEILSMAENPMFLGLLTEYIRVNRDFPENAHAVFEKYVQNRFDRDAEKITKRFGLTPQMLRSAAESAAFCMAGDPGIGLSPTRDVLRLSVLRMGFQWSDAALNALEFMKIARSDSGPEVGASSQFSFSHRRFQEYFATCVVLAEPSRVSPEALLTNGRWRETAVVLCQTQPVNTLTPIVLEAKRLLSLMRVDVDQEEGQQGPGQTMRRRFSWPTRSIHVLGLLQDASNGKRDLTQSLAEDADEILLGASRTGTTLDRIWAVEVAGVASDRVLLELLRASFRGHSRWLREVAFRQAARLGAMPQDVARSIRAVLVRLAAEGKLLRDRIETSAQLARLKDPKQFFSAARLLRGIFVIDFCLFCIYSLLLFRAHPLRGPIEKVYGTLFLSAGLTVALLTPYAYIVMADFGNRKPENKPSKKSQIDPLAQLFGTVRDLMAAINLGPPRFMIGTVLTIMLLSSPTPLRLTAVFDSHRATLVRPFVDGVLWYWTAWAPAAIFAVLVGKFTGPLWWPFLPLAPLLYLIQQPKDKLLALLRQLRAAWKSLLFFATGNILALLIVLLFFSRWQRWYAKHSPWIKSHLAIAVGAALILFIGLPLAVGGLSRTADYYAWRRWRAVGGSGPIDATTLEALLRQYRTTAFRVRVVDAVRQQGRAPTTAENEESLVRLAQRVEGKLPLPDTLAWGVETSDALYKLVEQVSDKRA